jgi:glutaredoxin
MLNDLTEKLRAFAHRGLDADLRNKHPAVQHARNLVSIVNELLGQPIRPPNSTDGSAPATSAEAPVPNGTEARQAPVRQAPVLVYFDGKDHRTRTKVEELLRGRDIAFQVLDVTDDEAERSWVTTAAKTNEFPIVVIGGTPVGGLAELTQLDLSGELVRRAFAAN